MNPNIPTKKEQSIDTRRKTGSRIKKKCTAVKRVKSPNKSFDSVLVMSAMNSTTLNPKFIRLIKNKVRNGENKNRLSSNEQKRKTKRLLPKQDSQETA